MKSVLKASAIAIAVSTLALGGAAAQDVDFSGQTVELVIPYAEGGGTDVWGRFFAPYLSRHLPGNPNVIVRNIPGGGSITGANQFAAQAGTDGLMVLGTGASTHFGYLLGDPRVQFDYQSLEPLLVSPTGGVVYVPADMGVSDPSEIGNLVGQELIYGSQGATSLDLVPMLAFEVLGLDVRHVFGMTGRADARLALERGEATIDYQTTSAYLASVAPLAEAGEVVPLFTYGVIDANGDLQRDPTFPDIPHFGEVYEMMHGEEPSGIAFDAYMAFYAPGFAAQKIFLLQDGTPQEIIDAYRTAFAAAVADPELQAAKGDILGEYDQAAQDDIAALYDVATNANPEAREWVRNYLMDNHNVSFD
jgi:tripartite-type tricarboxylate transporter receptor subunit TctC